MRHNGRSARCVFFDRDGIVNRSPGAGYVTRLEDFHILPEFLRALEVVNRKGYLAIVVTNQRGVSLGQMSAATVEQIHDRLLATVAEQGLRLDAVYYCPHEDGQCDCRKPAPGMLLRAAEEFGVDLSRSWMVGDSDRDIEAGRAAGCRTVLVGKESGGSRPDYRLDDISELPGFLERYLEG